VRNVHEIQTTGRPGRAFSSGSSWDMWSYRWCENCRNDINEDCPIILAAMFGDTTPQEWVEIGLQNYECTEFQPREEEQE
jgi:hypothetical protein